MQISDHTYNIQQISTFLETLNLFSEISLDEIQSFSKMCYLKEYKENDIIFLDNDPGSFFCIVLNGRIKITKNSTIGKQIIISLLTEGDSFGEMALILNKKRNANAVAISNTTILAMEKDNFIKFIKSTNNFTHNLLKMSFGWLEESNKLLESLTLHNSKQGILNTIRIVANKFGKQNGKKMTIPKKFTHLELAGFSGTSRKNFTLSLKKLEDEGVIRFENINTNTNISKELIIDDYDNFLSKYFK